jgi:hypothetical protein
MQRQYAWTVNQDYGRACGTTGYLEHVKSHHRHMCGRDMAR